MKAIDRQGKLFGAINILDLFLIIVLIGAGIFAASKFLGSDNNGGILTTGGTQEVTYELYHSAEFDFVVERIKPGVVIRNADNNQVIGEVVSVRTEPGKSYVPTASGEMVMAEVPNKQETFITMITRNASGGTPSIGGVSLLVGNRVKVKGADFQMEVIVSDVQQGANP